MADTTSAALELQISGLEVKNANLTDALLRARKQIMDLQTQVDLLNRPPSTIGVLVSTHSRTLEVEALIGTRRMRLATAPDLDFSTLSPGQLLRIDERMTVAESLGFPRDGTLTSVLELLGNDRALVSANTGTDHVVYLAGPLRHGALKAGDSVMCDLRAGFAYERVVRTDVEDLLTPEVPDVSYEDIGGLDQQITQVRDAVELPFTHPQLYRQYDLRPPRGILLYGPPGCGKTLIAKAVASSLATRHDQKTYFISIKGPELLNKFVGETERHIRSIFARARALASEDVPVVVFFDEMEALFRTRGTGISSDVETMIVPQLLAEMDGLESMDNVVVIGASNRPDMIDPAVLRPGRLDVRIRVERPNRRQARDIFTKYLHPGLPIASEMISREGSASAAISAMIDAALDRLYSRDESAVLFDVRMADGSVEPIYLSDLVSGAMIAGTVERAKKMAIKESLETGEGGLSTALVLRGVEEETRESMELASTSTPEEWARTVGLHGGEVAAMIPRERR